MSPGMRREDAAAPVGPAGRSPHGASAPIGRLVGVALVCGVCVLGIPMLAALDPDGSQLQATTALVDPSAHLCHGPWQGACPPAKAPQGASPDPASVPYSVILSLLAPHGVPRPFPQDLPLRL